MNDIEYKLGRDKFWRIELVSSDPISHLHRRPTVSPAAIEGIEPVLMKPTVPPLAVKAPRTYAMA